MVAPIIQINHGIRISHRAIWLDMLLDMPVGRSKLTTLSERNSGVSGAELVPLGDGATRRAHNLGYGLAGLQ